MACEMHDADKRNKQTATVSLTSLIWQGHDDTFT